MVEQELQESVIHINRVAKVVKGGRNFAFTALVAVGDGNGNAGIGYGKGSEVPLAIQKAIENAKRDIHQIPMAGSTIVHTITGEQGSSKFFLNLHPQEQVLLQAGLQEKFYRLQG
jgi:small subunit ribosomal protein S5